MYIIMCCLFFFFKQKTAYEMVSCDWSSDVCSSDLRDEEAPRVHDLLAAGPPEARPEGADTAVRDANVPRGVEPLGGIDHRAAADQHPRRPFATCPGGHRSGSALCREGPLPATL